MASKSAIGVPREEAATARHFDTLYYSPETHRGGLALPPFVTQALAAVEAE